jgi:hypothetical protein
MSDCPEKESMGKMGQKGYRTGTSVAVYIFVLTRSEAVI